MRDDPVVPAQFKTAIEQDIVLVEDSLVANAIANRDAEYLKSVIKDGFSGHRMRSKAVNGLIDMFMNCGEGDEIEHFMLDFSLVDDDLLESDPTLCERARAAAWCARVIKAMSDKPSHLDFSLLRFPLDVKMVLRYLRWYKETSIKTGNYFGFVSLRNSNYVAEEYKAFFNKDIESIANACIDPAVQLGNYRSLLCISGDEKLSSETRKRANDNFESACKTAIELSKGDREKLRIVATDFIVPESIRKSAIAIYRELYMPPKAATGSPNSHAIKLVEERAGHAGEPKAQVKVPQ
jgi:hypothetical protein